MIAGAFACPACGVNPREAAHYLCKGCWFRLPQVTRDALRRRDKRARARLSALYRAIRAGTGLEAIEIRK